MPLETFSERMKSAIARMIRKPFRINADLQLRPFRFEVTSVEDLGDYVLINATVLDRDTQRPRKLSFHGELHFLNQRDRTALIRAALLDFLKHEVDECLIDGAGRQLSDPHLQSFPDVLP